MPPWYITSQPVRLSLQPLVGWEMSTSEELLVFCEQKRQHTSDQPYITVFIDNRRQQPFNSSLIGTTQVSRYQKGKTSLDLLEQVTVSVSGISSAICKPAPCPWQITMPASHHSGFYRLDAFPATQPTVSKH